MVPPEPRHIGGDANPRRRLANPAATVRTATGTGGGAPVAGAVSTLIPGILAVSPLGSQERGETESHCPDGNERENNDDEVEYRHA